ncbi:MAG: YihY/virulence factor BrkB family protein [Clostridia bacterium]|nr:YihY/virulence factor BrkB family protein [Clostridia bacterium]MBQ3092331.1 YihY/virulence factor BrkB family protein [Clostridia bacterium]MBQ9924501.1 YihY/virulence factor BrkB family protein [Clostridia bacterium]
MLDKAIKVCSQLIKRYFANGVARSSAQLAYFLFFSFFPLIILANTIISRFNVDILYILSKFENIFPAEIIGIVTDYLTYIGNVDAPYIFFIGLFMTLYAMTRALNSLLTSVRQAYAIRKAGIVNYMTAAIFSALLLVSVFALSLLVMGSELAVDVLRNYLAIPDGIIALLRLLKYVLLPAYIFFVLAGFYYLVPSGRYPFVKAIPGAVFAGMGITLITTLFSYYVSNFSNYSLIYGSLTAVMVLMIWLQLVSTMLILGGELNDILIDMDRELLYRRNKNQ